MGVPAVTKWFALRHSLVSRTADLVPVMRSLAQKVFRPVWLGKLLQQCGAVPVHPNSSSRPVC